MTHPDTSPSLLHDAEAAANALPALLVEAQHLANAITMGVHGRRKAGVGETFWQYRPYVTGDSAQQIDWRHSARSADRLYVREMEWEIAATVWLWSDPDHSLDYTSSKKWPSKRRRADVIAAALAALLSRGGERVGLLGSDRQPLTGRTTLDRFIALLAESKTNGAPDKLPPLIQRKGPGLAVYISDFFTPIDKLEAQIRAAAALRIQGHLLQVLDPAEVLFPFKGRTEFLEQKSGPSLLFGNAAAIATDYKRKFEAHQSYLADLCGTVGWTFSSHHTDQPPQTALMALYTSLNPESMM